MTTPPDDDTATRICAVVVAFRSTPFLATCIDAVLAAGADSVVVVDNNGDDADATAVAALASAYPGTVRAVATGRNLGFGGACNVGAQHALHDSTALLWFVNPDTIASPDAARGLADAMRHHGYDLASPLLTTGPRGAETIWFGGGTLDVRTGRARHDLLGAPLAAAPAGPTPCTFLPGTALAVTRTAWERLGGFDTSYFLYWEDADLSWRATAAGLRLGIVPGAVVWHAEGASSADDDGRSALSYYYYTRNRLVLARRMGRLGGWLAGAGLLMTLKPIGAALLKERSWRKTAATLRGTFKGVLEHPRPTPHTPAE